MWDSHLLIVQGIFSVKLNEMRIDWGWKDKGTQQTSVLISLFQTQADNSFTKKGGGPYEIS